MSSATTENKLHVRCKRQNQTYFVRVSKSSTVGNIKAEISESLGGNPEPEGIRVYLPSDKTGDRRDSLPDAATVADHEIAVLYVVFRIEGKVGDGDDAWEDVKIETPSEMGE
jgi:hypothetical protein